MLAAATLNRSLLRAGGEAGQPAGRRQSPRNPGPTRTRNDRLASLGSGRHEASPCLHLVAWHTLSCGGAS